ncbi:MAG: arginyltransferase [Acetobacterales bacterium]
MTYKPVDRPQYFYTTALMPCPYLGGRMERKLVTELVGPHAAELHDTLSQAGFRRSHNIAYSPVCPGCNACVPVRVDTARFAPGRNLRRIARVNADVQVREAPARATLEQYELFERYQKTRHADGDMSTMGFYDYRAMVEDTPIDTVLFEFRDARGVLLAACLTDRVEDGLSAVYSFFDPAQARRSLGSYMVMWLIGQARSEDQPYVYLGYWIRNSSKMSYKARFRPLEMLDGAGWRAMLPEEIGEPDGD